MLLVAKTSVSTLCITQYNQKTVAMYVMKTRLSALILLLLAGIVFSLKVNAQAKLPSGWSRVGELAVMDTGKPNTEGWLKEDLERSGTRFAGAMHLNISPANMGEWSTTPDGRQRWQLRIRATEALGLAVFFDSLQMPLQSNLYIYAPYKPQYALQQETVGSLRSRSWLGFIDGEEVVIEYDAPAGSTKTPFHIWRLDYAYAADRYTAEQSSVPLFGFGSSSDCHDNINCPAGDAWQIEQAGVCRIALILQEGTGFCTGTLLNNTAGDGKPYLLSGFHCQDGYTPLFDLWRFDFFYQAAACPNPATEPAYTSVFGSFLRAGRWQSDFLLLELFPHPILNQLPRYGWDRSGTAPSTAGVVHHPRGDIKKIGLSTAASTVQNTVINWNNNRTTPSMHHFRVVYSNGTIEIGSSGASLFNQNRRIVGQLHGSGTPNSCDNTVGYFGRLSMSWEGGGTPDTRLRDWLDPIQSGVSVLDSLAGITSFQSNGMVRTTDSMAIAQVQLTAVNAAGDTLTATTGAEGTFSFPVAGILDSLWVTPFRNDNAGNGISTFDIILLRRHILNISQLDSPYKLLAADVNNSGSITTLDMIIIQRIILGTESAFTAVPSWRFVPQDYVFPDPANPFGAFPPASGYLFTFPSPAAEIRFIGIKSGDLNGSANPG